MVNFWKVKIWHLRVKHRKNLSMTRLKFITGDVKETGESLGHPQTSQKNRICFIRSKSRDATTKNRLYQETSWKTSYTPAVGSPNLPASSCHGGSHVQGQWNEDYESRGPNYQSRVDGRGSRRQRRWRIPAAWLLKILYEELKDGRVLRSSQ